MEDLPPTLAPSVSAPLPFTTRINYAIRLWAFKFIVRAFIEYSFLFKSIPAQRKPTYTKVYPVRSMVQNRVFLPASYKPDDKPLPLYIDVHGGGFAICDPRVDDPFCSTMAQQYGICVVSIGYRRAPRVAFPVPVEDVAALAQAVLDDPDIPYDKTKVAMGGFSAGGNLTLAALQKNDLHKKIGAAVAFYPAVDFAKSTEQKLADRIPDKDGKPDVLTHTAKLFNWGYVPQGTDRRHPLLSPAYAKREDLPAKMFFIGCEYDMLFREAEAMADQLATHETGEKKVVSNGDGWEKGNLRWERIVAQPHGFDQMPAKGEEEVVRVKRRDELYASVAEWLHREVYA